MPMYENYAKDDMYYALQSTYEDHYKSDPVQFLKDLIDVYDALLNYCVLDDVEEALRSEK